MIQACLASNCLNIKPKITLGFISLIDFRTPNFGLRAARCTTNKLGVH